MALVLLRHGQTDWNLEKRLQSRSDVPLNDTGRAQARRLRAALERRGRVPRVILTSPLQRARETAGILAHGRDATVRADERLLELDLGEFEGCLESELAARPELDFARWRAAGFRDPAPGGESLAEARARVRPLLDAIRERARGEDVALVGHQGINTAIKAELAGTEDPEALRDFAQANDEIDVWDPDAGHRLERFSV